MRLVVPPPNRTPGVVDVLGLLGVVGLLVARYVPVAVLIPGWGCVFREVTGWPCLGCGLTRVADRVAHLNFAGAWDANPLGTVCALAFAALAVLAFLHMAFRVPVPRLELAPREVWVARTAVVVLVLSNYAWVVVKTRFPHWLA